ncbi:histone-fold-containing protein [Mycena rebaudengoi]|nr:histone-fold-containing protein [Mycena rebaudengoi]
MSSLPLAVLPSVQPLMPDDALHAAASPASPPEPTVITEHEDRFLPIAKVSRIMKAVVPPGTKIGKDAKDVSRNASPKHSLNEKRKTIWGEDILYAMGTLGFDNYAEVLKIHLTKLREHQNASAGARNEHHIMSSHIEPRGTNES